MATATSTALAIPEVLASVLAYLDHTDLRAKVAFVCKDWYILCRRLTKAQYHWLGKIPLDKRYLFQQGGSAHVLPIISRSSTNYYIRPFKSAAAYGLPDWSRLHKLVSELPSEDQEHFCKLVAKSILDLQSTLELAQRFQVTTLRIENSWMETISLNQILLASPNLVHLDIDASTFGKRAIIANTELTANTTKTTKSTEQQIMQRCPAVVESCQTAFSSASSNGPLHRFPPCISSVTSGCSSSVSLSSFAPMPAKHVLLTSEPTKPRASVHFALSSLPPSLCPGTGATSLKLKLKRLSLNRVSLTATVLDALLSQCPDLVEFRMQHCTVAVSSSEARQGHQECLQNNDSFTRSMVLNLLQKYCPQLNSIHFSLLDSRPTEQDQIHMFQQLRTVQSWSIAHSDLLPSTFESLRLYASALISLELCCSCNSLAPETLHRYLCQAPRLQQLSIDNMVFPVEYLDLEYPSAQEAMQSNRNQVWACRNLRSLQIKFGSMTGNDTRTPKRSRHLFAYIAQVCPRLQQLHITRSLMNVQKEGGLCYLSGIESLERLTLQTTHFQTKHISDFGWIKAGASSSLGSPLSLSPFSTISSETSFTTVSSPSINGNAILRLTSRISRARKQTRNVFGGLLSRVTSMRSRSSSPDPLLEDRAIVKKIIQYASEENIKATMDKLAKRNGVDPVWPRLEYLVLDAVKYSGVSPESMAAIVAEARPGVVFRTF
ncbi:hypothetical protein MVEG_03628 [Podila verticillata NRRL 6337]|nr:hypothetical protein MVEG_03628 [Podila verticillata NRRL 6337]